MARRKITDSNQLSLFDSDSFADLADKEKGNLGNDARRSTRRPLDAAFDGRRNLRYETGSSIPSADQSDSDSPGRQSIPQRTSGRTQRRVPSTNRPGATGEVWENGNRRPDQKGSPSAAVSVPPTSVRNQTNDPSSRSKRGTVGKSTSADDGSSAISNSIDQSGRSDESNGAQSPRGIGTADRPGEHRQEVGSPQQPGGPARDAASDSALPAVDEPKSAISDIRAGHGKAVGAGTDASSQSGDLRRADGADHREVAGRGGEYLPGGRFTLGTGTTLDPDRYQQLASDLASREHFATADESIEGYALAMWRSQLNAAATLSGLVPSKDGTMAINPFWHTFSRMLSGFPDADVRAMVDSPEATDDYVYRAELELARRGYFYDDTAPPTEVEQHIAAVAFGKIALDDLSDNQAEAIYNYFTGPADTMLTPLQAWAYDATSLIVADRVAADPSHYVEQLRSGQTDSPLVRDALLPHLGHDLLLEAWAEGYVRRTATDTPAIALVDSEVGDLDDETLSASHAALIEASKGAPVHIRPVLDEIASEAYAELTNRTEHFDTGEATYVVTTTSPEEASQRLGQALSFVPPAQSLAPRGPKGRARANIDAIRLVAQLDTDNRWPTADEQRILAAYSGWGGASQIFDKNNTQWTKEYGELLDALPEGVTVTDLSSSVNTAFYTAPGVTKAMWDALETAGFSGGEVLEPGCGIGGFIGAAPETAHMTGVELDPIASRISSLLYPTDTVVNQSFTKLSTESKPFSAAIGNVPFNKDDKPHDPRYNPKGLSVHNYFISKSTELVQPGGYIALITSVSTSDAAMPTARKQITTNADVVTAVRLPEETFRTVAGTSVISDLLVLRVREPGQVPDERTLQWLSTENISLGSTTLTTNSFFAANPGNIIGTQSVGYDRFKEPIMRVNADEDTIAPQLSEILTREITAAVASGRGHTAPAVTNAQREALSEFTTVNATAEPIPGTITYTRDADGTYHFTQYEANGTWEPVTVAKAYHREWAELIDLREAEKTLQDAYKEDKGVAQAQQRLHSLYDAYLAAHGPINRFEIQPGRVPSAATQNKAFHTLADDWRAANGYEPGDPLPDATETLLREQAAETVPKKVQKHLGKLRDDPDMQRVLALEVFDENTGTATKSALFFRNPVRTMTRPTHADSLPDAISIARSETGGLDLRRIAELTDRDIDAVTEDLLKEGLAFRDPESPDELIERGDYLSGFVADKLDTARLAAETDPRLRTNVTELLAVQPPEVTDFTVRPGATWIPATYYEQFAAEKLGATGWSRMKISRDTGEWKISVDSTYWAWGGNADMAYGLVVANNRAGKAYNFQATGPVREATNQGVGCNRKDGVAVPAFKTFEAILNLSAPQASWSKEWVDTHGIKPGTHGQATAFLARRAQALQEEFSDWVMSDPARAREVTRAYNKAFNGFVPRAYDGSARALPGLGDKFTPTTTNATPSSASSTNRPSSSTTSSAPAKPAPCSWQQLNSNA